MFSLLYILLLSLSFAVDAFAVATSTAIATPGFRKRDAAKIATWFGAFQFGMPLAGWLLATGMSRYIEAFDHLIAFGLLAFIGGKMVWGSFDKTCEVGSPDISARLPLSDKASIISSILNLSRTMSRRW